MEKNEALFSLTTDGTQMNPVNGVNTDEDN